MKKIIVALLAALILTGCSKTKDTSIIRVGLVGGDQTRSWEYVKSEAKKEGINLELVYFSDYPQPNAALHSKDIDMNAFQHHIYLEEESKTNGYKLTAIGDTFYSPLGLYSKNITNLHDLKEGDTIAIPSDVTNGARALKLLEAQGLIKLDGSDLPDKKSIIENQKNFNIFELEASNIPGSLGEVALAAINSGIAVDAGYSPQTDAIALELVTDSIRKYNNIIVVRTEDKDLKDYKRIVEIYQTDAVKNLIIEETKGASIPVF